MDKPQLLDELKQESFSKKVLEAFSKIPRENFIPKELKQYAYNNEPLPIGQGATISQPYTIAFMLELLELDKLNIDNIKQDKMRSQVSESDISSKSNYNLTSLSKNNETERDDSQSSEKLSSKSQKLIIDNINKIKILEIGSGCGYVLALINQILPDSQIYGIEINKELVNKSKNILKNNKNIKIIQADGSKGFSEKAPFDRILISAACYEIPKHLFKQLKRRSGILVCPVRNSIYQIKKKSHSIIANEFPGFVFVPLVSRNI